MLYKKTILMTYNYLYDGYMWVNVMLYILSLAWVKHVQMFVFHGAVKP